MAAPYDPRAHGALCDQCTLCGKIVVPPETNTNAWIAVVAEAPGEVEEQQGRPLCGPSGAEFNKALYMASLQRRDCHLTNALLCRPQDNDLKRLLTQFNKLEAARKKACKTQGIPYVAALNPLECCAPRLEAELTRFKNFITLGKVGTRAVTGKQGSILALRGGLIDLAATSTTPARKVMPTVHPAFVLRMSRWTHVFRNDVFKAAGWFKGQSAWQPPRIVFNPAPAALRQFLSSKDRIYAFDLETDNIEPLEAHIRCVAVGDAHDVMVVGFRSNTQPLWQDGLFLDFYYGEDAHEIAAILTDFFQDHDRVKAAHNGILYDCAVLKRQMGIAVENCVDTILLYKSVESELPKNLAHVASLYVGPPSWKTDRENNKIALGGETDRQLHEYCAWDTSITAALPTVLASQVRLRDQLAVWHNDQAMQRVCAAMHEAGMYVDQEARLAKEKELLARRYELLKEIRGRTQLATFNPMSIYQMRDLLFESWGLDKHLAGLGIKEEEMETGSGDLSTGDFILRTLLTAPNVPDAQREIIKLLRRYRKTLKILGTYVVKMRHSDVSADLGWDEDDDWVDKETRKMYGDIKRGIVNPATGRMYPGYSISIPVTGRLSSFKPFNAQNCPKELRSLVTAAPGHVLVGADMDQLELRIAAALWRVQLYLRAFAEGKDPHSMTAFAVFGNEFCKEAGIDPARFAQPGILVGQAYDAKGKFIGTGNALDLRRLSKNVQFCSQYMGSVETVHKLIQKAELPAVDPKTGQPFDDGTTDLPYARIPLKKVRHMRDNWLRGAPEFETGWRNTIEDFRRDGYLREPVGGRRRDFLDGENPNEIVNFRVQSSAAAMVNCALIQLHDQIPLHKWGPGTGVINQCHDALVVECPADGATWVPDSDPVKAARGKGKMVVPEGSIPWQVARLMEACMTQAHASLPGLTFTATASVGRSWKDV